MSNLELLDQLRQLSPAEKFQIMQFLMAELAKEEMLKPLDNGAAYRVWSPYNYGDAAQKLMSLLEQEEAQEENVKCYYSGSQKSEVCPMPYALCPMPYALCPVVPHLSEKGYSCFTRKL